MAKLMVYSVYDSKVKFYDRPFFLRNRGEAVREWEKAANDEKTTIAAHPHDFALFELGEFDDQTGQITMLQVPESLGLAVHYKHEPKVTEPQLPGISMKQPWGEKEINQAADFAAAQAAKQRN